PGPATGPAARAADRARPAAPHLRAAAGPGPRPGPARPAYPGLPATRRALGLAPPAFRPVGVGEHTSTGFGENVRQAHSARRSALRCAGVRCLFGNGTSILPRLTSVT